MRYPGGWRFLFLLAPPASAASLPGPDPRIEVRIAYAGEESPFLQVDLAAEGLDPERRDLRVWIQDWGEWTEAGGAYVTEVSGSPPVAREGTDFRFDLPEAWDGSLRLRYRLSLRERESEAQRAKPLLPVRAPSYWHGFAANTLPRIRVDGEPLGGERIVRLEGPPGWKIVTGWGGITEGTQVAQTGPDDENAHLAMGRPVGIASSEREGSAVEVIQFGEARDVTEVVRGAVQALAPEYERTMGRPLGHPIRVILNDYEPGGTSTHRDLGMGFTPRQSERGEETSPRWIQTLAHELAHQWIGNLVRPAESLVWFSEGFTDYVSLWHVAKTGLVSRDWFAQRLGEIDAAARRSPAYGKTSFADPSVRWRDGDGALETLAYRGGAMAAFHLDLALRDARLGGVGELFRDWIEAGEIDPDIEALRRWLDAADLGGFFEIVVRGGVLPDLRAALAQVGFVPEPVPARLTYTGIEAEGSPFGRIVALDPEGPAARAGLRVGDAISGLSPTRSDPPEISDEVATRFRWGLTLYDPESDEWRISVYRGDEKIRAVLSPRILEGGFHLRQRSGDADRFDRFFR